MASIINKTNDKPSQFNNFISRIKQGGLLSTANFYVIIPDFSNDRDLLMFCDGVNIPGIDIMTTEVRVYGELTMMPHAPVYNNRVTLNFICDSSMKVKAAMENWLDMVFDRKKRSLNYYDSYTKNVDIYMLDKANNDVYKVTLFEAYPIHIGDIQLDYSNSGIVKIPMGLTFKWWEADSSVGATYANNANSFLDILNNNLGSNPVYGNAYLSNNLSSTLRSGSQTQFLNGISNSPETQGIYTGITSSGNSNINVMNGYGSVGPIIGNKSPVLSTMGSNIGTNFSSASNTLAAAFGAAPVTTQNGAQYVSMMSIQSQSIARDMADYSTGLTTLSRDLTSITRPASLIGTSVTALGGTLRSINGTLASIGITNSPFAKVANEFISLGGQVGQAVNLTGLTSGLTSIGSNMTATGSIFQQVNGSIAGSEGYSSSVDKAMRQMANAFTSNGSDTMNIANVLGNYQAGQ